MSPGGDGRDDENASMGAISDALTLRRSSPFDELRVSGTKGLRAEFSKQGRRDRRLR
jgi:hypothetical protein